jgi:hypothetical protein
MNPLRIAAVVEGHGEVQAVPELIRRCASLAGWPSVTVDPVIRQAASKLLRPRELERVVVLAARKLQGFGGIFVLLDCDDDCPAILGPSLLARVKEARPDMPTSVVLARREYEAWFLGSAASLAGRRGLPADLRPHPTPELVRGCKEWLSDQMQQGRAYNEVDDQPALTALFELDAARLSCPSFDKCHRELMALLKRVSVLTSNVPPLTG